MHPLMPEVLGVAEPDFIWVTNAGNIITSPVSSTVRSLALACAVQGGKEIAILGHTDCLFFQPTKLVRNQHWANLRSELSSVADALDEFVHRFVDERQNVDLAVKLARSSPLISRRIPIHGLMVDVESGRLEWVVNGYEACTVPNEEIAGAVEASHPSGGGSRPTASAPLSHRASDFKLGDDLPPIGTEHSSG